MNATVHQSKWSSFVHNLFFLLKTQTDVGSDNVGFVAKKKLWENILTKIYNSSKYTISSGHLLASFSMQIVKKTSHAQSTCM